jgi:phytoene synthase
VTSLVAGTGGDGVEVLDAQTVAIARQVLATHAKSFRFAGLFLPAHRLDDAAVVYAFCRLVDDAIDEAPDRDQAQREAATLARELDGAAPARPEVRAFLSVARRLDLDVSFARHLVEGVAFDANERVRIADDAGLLRYCYLVAGTVGGMMCAVLGVKDPAALPAAIDLGIGMQLTNISRDVREDAHKDRAYVPASRLRAAGLNAGTFVDDVVADRADHPATAVVVRDLLALAERYYASADAGMRFIPWRSRLAILVAGRVYRAIGRKLLRTRGGDALQGRVSTTLLEKLAQMLVAVGAFARLAFAPPRAHDGTLHATLRGLPGTAGPEAVPPLPSASRAGA